MRLQLQADNRLSDWREIETEPVEKDDLIAYLPEKTYGVAERILARYLGFSGR